LGRDCDNFTLHIYASLAEQERKMISERLKAAFAVAKAKGMKFGLARCSKARRRGVIAMGHAALRKAEAERAEAYRLHIEWAFRQPSVFGGERPISFSGAAAKLNDRNIASPMGGRWTASTLKRMGGLLGLDHPAGMVPTAAVRDRVRELWRENPEITSKQVRACPPTWSRSRISILEGMPLRGCEAQLHAQKKKLADRLPYLYTHSHQRNIASASKVNGASGNRKTWTWTF
jgi:hypothetical protein